jgi:hypothetical protein
VPSKAPARPRVDAALAAAVDVARAAAVDVGGDTVGDYVAVRADGERVATHTFASTSPAYRGWYWAVTLARAPRGRTMTVDEVVLLPGEGAMLAPEWVPWEERVRPGDLAPGDLLPARPDDARLVPAYIHSDDPAVEVVALELGFGRKQVMSREGRVEAAERWYAGDHGPDTGMARHAPGRCGTCGFYLPLAGSLQAGFGVCGNELTEADGAVVSVEYGCGAHSDAEPGARSSVEVGDVVYDDGFDVTVP